MVLNAPNVPAPDKAELLELLAGDSNDEETISFNAAAAKLGTQLYNVYKLAAEGELRTRKLFTVKTAITMASFREYLAKHGKGGVE
jgi:hypothetical protein